MTIYVYQRKQSITASIKPLVFINRVFFEEKNILTI